MRKLPLLLSLLLFLALGTAVPAQASALPFESPVAPLLVAAAEEEDEEEAEEPEELGAEEPELEEEEACEPEEGEPCEEELEPRGKGKGEGENAECLLTKASATVTANPGKRRLRLSVRYKTLKPATVTVEASLRGGKGVLHLGSEHARFRRSGVYRDTFSLAEKQMRKAASARDFAVELHVVNTPPSCRVELSAHRDGSKKLIWS
jgi:hypothetical protein